MGLDFKNFPGGEGSDEVSHGQIFSWIRACPCKHELSLKCRSELKLNPDSCKLYPLVCCEFVVISMGPIALSVHI